MGCVDKSLEPSINTLFSILCSYLVFHWNGNDVSKDFGVGFKYGVTSSITSDFTYNPDFSQVESDAFQAEVNRRYPVFYSEKRPFFMEGTDIFEFSLIGHGMMGTTSSNKGIFRFL